MKLVFASNNAHKLAEVRHILSQIEVVSLRDIGFLQEIDETGQTLEENSRLKAITVWQWLISNHLDSEYNGVFADDTGLKIQALGGAPGVYSASRPHRHPAVRAQMISTLKLPLSTMHDATNITLY